MQYTDRGLRLTLDEINALLAFTATDPARTHLYGVHFEIVRNGIRARATNGHIALDALGSNRSEERTWGEWLVHRDFLKGAAKVLQGTDELCLQFSGASLRDASVWDKDGNERSVFSWPNDAANSQISFPDRMAWRTILTAPEGTSLVSCVTLNADYLALMGKVSKAAGKSAIECYPPPTADERAFFRIQTEEMTWLAVVMPIVTKDEKPSYDNEEESTEQASATEEATKEPALLTLEPTPRTRKPKSEAPKRGKKKTSKKVKGRV